MKKIFYVFGILLGLGLASCTNTELDPLDGVFPSPTLIDYTSNATIVAEKDGEGRRVFTLDITDGTTPFHATLIGNKYFLTANTYTEAMDAVAKNGNFVIGKTSIAGKQVKQGTIEVSIVDEKETADGCENTYYIATILFLEDGTPYKSTWQGKLSFEADKVLAPELFYTDETAGAVDNTFTPVAGVTTHNLTVKNASGEAVAWFQLVLTEGVTDFSGDYVCKEYAHEDHTFGNGYDLSMYGMGLGGTRYVADDGNTVLVQPGETLSITSMGDGVYSIDGSTGYSFLIAPEGYVPGAGTVYTMTDETAGAVDSSFTPVEGVTTHNLTLKDASGEAKVWFQLVLTEGETDFSGEYVCKEYAHEDHTFGNGYDLSMYGMGLGGTRYVAEDGNTILVQPGETLTVTKIADDTYKFEGSTDYSFTGKLVADTPGPGPQPGDAEELTFTQFLSLSSYVGMGVNLAGINLATSGLTYTPADWAAGIYSDSYAGSGNMLKLEYYTTDGTLAPGTYKACAVGGTVGEGEFGIGYDGQWGASGTTLYTITDGTPDAGKYITDGTLTVSVNGDVYTIELESSILKAKYVGRLSNESAPVVELTQFLSLSSYVAMGVNLAGVNLATSGLTYTPADWAAGIYTDSYAGSGNMLKFEFYTTDGTLVPGTYKACAVGGTVGEGEFGIGYDGQWGASGTTWYTITDGTPDAGVYITDGTATVSVEGDVYTIELESSVVNAKYVGKLSKDAAPATGM